MYVQNSSGAKSVIDLRELQRAQKNTRPNVQSRKSIFDFRTTGLLKFCTQQL